MSRLPAILFMSPGLLEGTFMGAWQSRDLSSHTHAYTYMHIHSQIDA